MPSPLARKLLIKPDTIVMLMDPPDGYRQALGELPVDVTVVGPGGGPAQVIQLFVRSRADLAAAAEAAIDALTPGGVLWICYPKVSTGVSDLSREGTWELMEPHGWRAVTQVAIDDTWSALRFRPIADVKSTRA